MMLLELTFVRQAGEHDRYHCKPERTYSIGRGSDCAIRILDFLMSRLHAELQYRDDHWYVENKIKNRLGSSQWSPNECRSLSRRRFSIDGREPFHRA